MKRPPISSELPPPPKPEACAAAQGFADGRYGPQGDGGAYGYEKLRKASTPAAMSRMFSGVSGFGAPGCNWARALIGAVGKPLNLSTSEATSRMFGCDKGSGEDSRNG